MAKKANIAWSDEELAIVGEMAAAGKSSSTIAARFGVSRNAVIGLCSRRNIRLSGTAGSRADSAFVARLRGAISAGNAPAEIAAAEGLTVDQIRDRARYWGLVFMATDASKPKAKRTSVPAVRHSFVFGAAQREASRRRAVERVTASRTVVCLSTESARRVGEASGCRWPLWNADTPWSEKLVCGRGQEAGGSYCSEHAMMAYRPPEARRAA